MTKVPVNLEGFEALLGRLAAESGDHFGDPSASIEPLARLERPFSSLLRLRIDAAGRQFGAFLKIFKPRLSTDEELRQLRRWVQREYDATACLYQAFAGNPGLSAVRPIAVFPDQLALATEEAIGVPFDRVIRSGLWGRQVPAPLTDIAQRIGAWIRTYQQVTASSGEMSLDERQDYLSVRLRRLTAAGVFREQDVARTLERVHELARLVDSTSLGRVAIHADLCPTNILIGPTGGVTILDFAMAKSGARFHDISHLFMHLEFQRWRPRLLTRVLPDVQAALLAGFDPDEPAERHPLFQLMLIQHVICHLALLAEPQSGILRPTQAWLARRRWQRCAVIAGIDLDARRRAMVVIA
jgi:Phosphotransferase enzyme family